MAIVLETEEDMWREADLLFERHRPATEDPTEERRCVHCLEVWPCPGIKLAARAYAALDPYRARHRELAS